VAAAGIEPHRWLRMRKTPLPVVFLIFQPCGISPLKPDRFRAIMHTIWKRSFQTIGDDEDQRPHPLRFSERAAHAASHPFRKREIPFRCRFAESASL